MAVVRRLLQMAAMLALLSVALFYLLHLMPGSPEEMILAADPSLDEAARLRALRGLDRPIIARWGCWLAGRHQALCAWWPGGEGILAGDLGYSSVHRLPVARVIAERLPNTLRLMLPALLLSLLLSVSLGVLAAVRPGGSADHLVRGLSVFGASIPAHWLGLMAILAFAVGLGWLPASGIDDLDDPGVWSSVRHAVLPVSVLVLLFVGRWARHLRSALLEVMRLEFLDAARAKGLSERRVIFAHALRNALLPLITVASHALPALFSGALVVERVFSYPGMGLLIFESVAEEDHLVAVVLFLVYAALTMLSTLLADLAYSVVDPRVRFGGASA